MEETYFSSKKKDFEILCLNEVKMWQPKNLNKKFIVVNSKLTIKSKGPMFLTKKGATIIKKDKEKILKRWGHAFEHL